MSGIDGSVEVVSGSVKVPVDVDIIDKTGKYNDYSRFTVQEKCLRFRSCASNRIDMRKMLTVCDMAANIMIMSCRGP